MSRTKDEPLTNPSINRSFLGRLLIQSNKKLSITGRWRNKTENLIRNSMILRFEKKASMPNPVKSLWYITCCSSRRNRHVKNHSNSISYNYQAICSQEKTCNLNQKKDHNSQGNLKEILDKKTSFWYKRCCYATYPPLDLAMWYLHIYFSS